MELERIAVHIGDMGAIAGDIAYLMGAAVFGATRTLVINTSLDICGNRFGRGEGDNGDELRGNFYFRENCIQIEGFML